MHLTPGPPGRLPQFSESESGSKLERFAATRHFPSPTSQADTGNRACQNSLG